MPKQPKKRTLFDRAQSLYGRTLAWALRIRALMMLVLLVTIGLNVVLFTIIPKGFFPQQDTGLLIGGMQADQSISFQAMQKKLTADGRHRRSTTRRSTTRSASPAGQRRRRRPDQHRIDLRSLKPLSERANIDTVMAGLRRKLAVVPGARLFLRRGPGSSASAAGKATRPISTRCRPTAAAELIRMGAEADRGAGA